jgi:hypothetical protein
LPPRAWAKLTRILNAIEIDGQWPEGLGTNLLALLGKPKGGERAITNTHNFYAIWTRARRAFRLDCEKALQAFWGNAVSAPSGGALKAALTKRLCDMVAVERRQASLEVSCDIESLNVVSRRPRRSAWRFAPSGAGQPSLKAWLVLSSL